MKTFKQLALNKIVEINEAKNDFDEVVTWIDSLTIGGRTPKGMKNQHNILIKMKEHIASVKENDNNRFAFGYFDRETYVSMIMSNLQHLDKAEIDLKFGPKDDKPTKIKKKYASYEKEDGSAYPKFLEAIDEVEDLLSSLKGYHKKAIKNLKVKFVKKSVSGSKAKYKRNEDTIWVNLASAGKTKEEYGSLRYIIVHELGHRYLTTNRQSWPIDSYEWSTTRYSLTDSMSGEEKFAELFAISHWESKYKEYSEKIAKFKKIIE